MAPTYSAPLDDIGFVLREIVDLDRLAQLDGFDSVSTELVDQILGEAAKFAEEVVAPLNKIGDEQGSQLVNGVVRTPEGFVECYHQFVEAGWMSVAADPEFGGMGLPWTLAIALNEMWQAANMSLADGWMLTQGAIDAIEAHGTDEQKQTYLPNLISGNWSGTMNLTEPGAGSDVGALRTRAVAENGHWRINGTKIFITHGDQDMSENIVHLVLARTEGAPQGVKGISLFIVPKKLVTDDGAPGTHNDLRVVSLEHKMGHMGSPTAMMSYGDNEGALGTMLGDENRGMACMFTMMNNARLNVALQGVSIADRAYQAAVQWARERVQGTEIGGNPKENVTIIRHPDVRRMLLEMRSQTEAMRAMCYSLAEAVDSSRRDSNAETRAQAQAYLDLMTPVAKAWCTDQGFAIASIGVQVHGGMGYIEETGAAQYLRDARITMIYEGTNGIQALDLVRRKLQVDQGAAVAKLIADMRETLNDLAQRDDPALAAIAGELGPAIDALERSTDWIRATFAETPADGAAGATAYCRMMGFVAGGWLMARAALRAKALAEADGDSDFTRAKIVTARFYAEQYLPEAAAIEGTIRTARNTVFAMPEEVF